MNQNHNFIQVAYSLRLFFFLLIIGSLISCKTFRPASQNKGENKSLTLALNKIKKETVDFKTLSISGKTRVNLPAMNLENVSVNYQVNMANDSLMIIRLRKLGIEAARIKINKDSIFILSKLDRTLISSDYTLAEKYTGLEADFGVLQDLFLGNFHQIPEKVTAEKMRVNPLILKGSKNGTGFSYFIDTGSNKVIKIEAENSVRNQASVVTYSAFLEAGGTQVPSRGKVSVLAPSELSFDFDHKKIQINPSKVSFKFSVPSGYDRVEPK